MEDIKIIHLIFFMILSILSITNLFKYYRIIKLNKSIQNQLKNDENCKSGKET